jgi:hypothetical protein
VEKTVFALENEALQAKRNGWLSHGIMSLPHGQSAENFSKGPCRVLVSHEDHNGKMRWHLSISCKDRYPGWEEIKAARYSLLPLDLVFAQILPPPSEYTNIHRNCFHLWEIEDGEW